MNRHWIFSALLGLTCMGTALYADNNFVKTLKTTEADGKTGFTMPANGWVYFEGAGKDDVTIQAGDKTLTVAPRNGAVMVRLPKGSVTVNGKITGARRIGENLYYHMAGDFTSDDVCRITTDKSALSSGRPGLFLYHWKFLNKNILDSFNVLALGSPWDAAIDQWKREGRIVIHGGMLQPTGEANLANWNKFVEDGKFDGVMPDEFVIPAGRKAEADGKMGYSNPGSGFKEDIFEAIRTWGKAHPDKRFFAWLGLPWECKAEDAAPLVKALPPDGAIMWEAYTHTRKFEEQELVVRLYNRSKQFKKIKGDLKRFRLILGTYEFLDNNYAIDFKVALDKELNIAANHPDFRGIGGAGLWAAHYTDPEIMRWYAALVKHYAVDGEKSMLSDKYGFKLQPGIIANPEWQTLDGWKVSGSADLLAYKESGLPGTYLPKSRHNLLRFKRNEDEENTVSLPLQGLQAGKLYSVETRVVDPANDGSMADYALTFRVDGAEEVKHCVRRQVDFGGRKLHVFNEHKLVFRAGKGNMTLVIGDGGEDADGEKPEVLLVDSLRVTPYFE